MVFCYGNLEQGAGKCLTPHKKEGCGGGGVERMRTGPEKLTITLYGLSFRICEDVFL